MDGSTALAPTLQTHGLSVATAREVAQLAAAGNPQAIQEVRSAARHVGEVLAALVSFANPEIIIIGGPLATRSLRIETSALDDEAGTIGTVRLAQEHLLSPAGVARLLGTRGFT